MKKVKSYFRAQNSEREKISNIHGCGHPNDKGHKIIATVSPYNSNTMQHREWQRGYNFAYFKNLEKVKRDEVRRRSTTVHAG